jgi:hypothetical protein
MNRFNIKSLTLTLGIVWGLGMLFLGWAAWFGWGDSVVSVFSSFYIGYKATFLGGIIGGIWGFVDGAIGGFLIAIFYNWLTKKLEPKK